MSHIPPMPPLTRIQHRRPNPVLQPQRRDRRTSKGRVPPNSRIGYPVVPQQNAPVYQQHSLNQPTFYNNYPMQSARNANEQYVNPQRPFSAVNYAMGDNRTNNQAAANVTNQQLFNPTEIQPLHSQIHLSNMHPGYNNHQNNQDLQPHRPWTLQDWQQYKYNQTFHMKHLQQQVEVEVNMRQRYLDTRNNQQDTAERQYATQHQPHGMQAVQPCAPFSNQHLSAMENLIRLNDVHLLRQQHEKVSPMLSHISQGRLPPPLLSEVEGRERMANEYTESYPNPHPTLEYQQSFTDLVEPQSSRFNFDVVEASTTSRPNSTTLSQTNKDVQAAIQEVYSDIVRAQQTGQSVVQERESISPSISIIPFLSIDDEETAENTHQNDRHERPFQKANMNCPSEAPNSFASLLSLTESEQDPTRKIGEDKSTFLENLSPNPLNFNPTPPPTPPDDPDICGITILSKNSGGVLPSPEIIGIFKDGCNTQESSNTMEHKRSHSSKPQSRKKIPFENTHFCDVLSICSHNKETSQTSLNVEQSCSDQDISVIEHESTPTEQFTIPQKQDSRKDSQKNEELVDCKQKVDEVKKSECMRSSGLMSPHYRSSICFIDYNPLIHPSICFVCQNVVSAENIVNHIWFTYLQCKDCDLTIKTCCMWTELREGRLEKCRHKRELHNFYKWAVDPVDFLYYQIRKYLRREHDSHQPTENEVIEEMANYTQRLSSLNLNVPWKDAVGRCRRYIKGIKSTLSRADRKAKKREEQDVHISESDGKISRKKSMVDVSQEALSHREPTESIDEQASNGMINEPIPRNVDPAQLNLVAETNEILPEVNLINEEPEAGSVTSNVAQKVDKINDEDFGDLLLPQPYNLEMLDQATTYVTVSELPEPAERRSENALVTEKPSDTPAAVNGCSQNPGTKAVAKGGSESHQPSDDRQTNNDYFLRYYYPDEKVPEECPMCYHIFSASMFVFNSVTLELRVECPDCKLLMFVSFKSKMSSPRKKRKIGKHRMQIIIKKTDM